MSDLYLIAHKVRGAPAFDIATHIQIGDEEGWIIPTSGHRAYPYWNCPLDCLGMVNACGLALTECFVPMPPDTPDHYSCNDRPSRERNPLATALDKLLNLGRKPPADFRRRV